jgi:hypothetical protein
MAYFDTYLQCIPLTASGESRFTRPVAAITAFVQRLAARWHDMPPAPRARREREIRALEEEFARATDHADLERRQRAYDRR